MTSPLFVDSWGDPGLLRPKDITRILATLPDKLEISKEQLEGQLQSAAWWFWHSSEALRTTPEAPPSVIERRWHALTQKIAALRSNLESVRCDTRQFADWDSAAQELANPRRGIAPPHVAAEQVSLELLPGQIEPTKIDVWPIDKAFDEALRSVNWLAVVTERAAQRAVLAKMEAGAPKADEPSHTFVRSLATIYERATGLKPKRPTYFDEREGSEGRFLDFVEAAFDPLDERSREAVASLVKRVLF